MTAFNPPTGVLLGTYTPGTPEWDKARAGLCITATEIAAVMGLSPWASRFSLWHKKAGLPTPPFESNPAVEWGNRLEDAVAQKFADEHPELELRTTGTWRHRDREWQRATPDRIAQDRLVEVKTSPFGDGWGPAGSDELPIYYRCQVQWQLDTLGLDVCHVALLVSGHDYREYVVEYDETDAKVMRGAAERFLDDVRQGNRPPIDGADATYQTIRVQPVGREERDVEISAEHAADYDIAQQAYRDADTELTRARGQILDAIGTGYRAVHGDRRIAYRTVKDDGTTLALQPYRGTA
ncbi:YqaJ viral recombinase family protein [Streptomyces sp. NBC_00893]|uniref:YqaJ viral recombinase family nuclease n=1 Tax=Streptomyces sp. NBC_00893 TaxID=2975862 RepID=UPI00224ED9A2|nr:YqaJ viral recombinase family protein [Streptomyces sp. NBC_00893]MCX4849791.1 YqaJ viral recombinase family protein [Streptomyces sp. NBC_00893]